jgi:hypothetical protein
MQDFTQRRKDAKVKGFAVFAPLRETALDLFNADGAAESSDRDRRVS